MQNTSSTDSMVLLPAHRSLNNRQRQSFLNLYQQSEHNYPIFRWIRTSSMTMFVWLVYINSFILWAIHSQTQSDWINQIILAGAGVLSLQMLFIVTHVQSHALFLEYDQHYPNSPRIQQPPIYFYAFYHHHHSRSDNWAPDLGFFSKSGLNPGFITKSPSARNIISSHWHGFSFLSTINRSLFVAILSMYSPKILIFFSGYELGVILLPLAHGWQHTNPRSYGYFRYLFQFLEYFGIIAGPTDHHKHHAHNLTPTVYQDFCSSGLYLKSLHLDNYVNRFWDWTFYQSVHQKCKPYDIIRPWVIFSLIVIMFIFPLLCVTILSWF